MHGRQKLSPRSVTLLALTCSIITVSRASTIGHTLVCCHHQHQYDINWLCKEAYPCYQHIGKMKHYCVLERNVNVYFKTCIEERQYNSSLFCGAGGDPSSVFGTWLSPEFTGRCNRVLEPRNGYYVYTCCCDYDMCNRNFDPERMYHDLLSLTAGGDRGPVVILDKSWVTLPCFAATLVLVAWLLSRPSRLVRFEVPQWTQYYRQ